MKRFTETTKWDDPWFIDLSSEAKVFWQYLLDKCDNAGVIDLSERQAEFLLNGKKSIKELFKEVESRLETLDDGKIYISSFVEFQFGELSESSNLHKNVILLLKKHNLFKGSLRVNEPFSKGPSKGKGISKGEGKGKKGDSKGGKHEFKNSEFYDKKFFKKQFEGTDYEYADLDFYYESVKNWAASSGSKKLDWIATARNFILGDQKTGKLKLRHDVNNNNEKSDRQIQRERFKADAKAIDDLQGKGKQEGN